MRTLTFVPFLPKKRGTTAPIGIGTNGMLGKRGDGTATSVDSYAKFSLLIAVLLLPSTFSTRRTSARIHIRYMLYHSQSLRV